eukprot:tig00000269_g23765.t1
MATRFANQPQLAGGAQGASVFFGAAAAGASSSSTGSPSSDPPSPPQLGLAGSACPFHFAEAQFKRGDRPSLVPRVPPPAPGEAGAGGEGGRAIPHDYALKSYKRYRLALAASDPETAALAKAPLLLRLVFADSGKAVANGLVSYPAKGRSTRKGVPLQTVAVRINAAGYTDERFGLGVLHGEARYRVLRLLIERGGAGGGAGEVVASLALRLSSKLGALGGGRASAKRARGAPSLSEGSGASGDEEEELEEEGDSGGLSGPSPPDSLSPRAPAPPARRPARPSGPNPPPAPSAAQARGERPPSERPRRGRGGGGAGREAAAEPDDLVEAFEKLNPYKGHVAADDAYPELQDPGYMPPTPGPPDGAWTGRASTPEEAWGGADPKTAADAFIREIDVARQREAQPFHAFASELSESIARHLHPAATLPPLPDPARSWAPPPYRQTSEAAREAAIAWVAAAEAALRGAAAAAGVRHPVRAGQPVPSSVQRACGDLAAVLGRWDVLDTRLLGLLDGRYRVRRALEDLRLCGSALHVEGVLAAWRRLLLAEGAGEALGPADAQLMAEHLWNVVELLTGNSALVPLDLLAVPASFLVELVERAEALVLPHREAIPLQYARALQKKGWLRNQLEGGEAGYEHYFSAWSLLVRSGNSPSRLEAEVIAELTFLLLSDPSKAELASHLCSKVYWFTEDREDCILAAGAQALFAIEAIQRKNWQAAKKHFQAGVEMLETMPDAYRARTEKYHAGWSHCCLRTGDFRGVLKHTGIVSRLTHQLNNYSWHEMDQTFALKRNIRSMVSTKEGNVFVTDAPRIIKVSKWFIAFDGGYTFRRSPMRPFMLGHMYYHLGDAYMAVGEWAKALRELERAQATLYHAYPAYFPPHQGRVVAVGRAVEECRRRLAGPAPGAGPGAGAGASKGGTSASDSPPSSSNSSSEGGLLAPPAPFGQPPRR